MTLRHTRQIRAYGKGLDIASMAAAATPAKELPKLARQAKANPLGELVTKSFTEASPTRRLP